MKKANLLVAALLVMSFAGGCGNTNQNTDATPTTTTQQTQKTPLDIAYEKFEKVPMRASYDQVKQILGVDGVSTASNTIGNLTTEAFNFNVNGIRIYVQFQNGELSMKQIIGGYLCNKKITLDQYNKIQNGMTYDQVKQIFDCDGSLNAVHQYSNGDKSMHVIWRNESGSYATITFDANGNVKMKMQAGLH